MSSADVRDFAYAGIGSIAIKVNDCLESFNSLCLTLGDQYADFTGQIELVDVQDELGRFRVWSGNTGAHKGGRKSLDYRLRDASHIRLQVVSLLDDLRESLQDAIAIVSGAKVPWDRFRFRRFKHFLRIVNPTDSSNLEDSTELKQLLASVRQTVTLLMRLSMAIRRPARHDQYTKSMNIDTTHFEKYDIEHVRQMFPQAEEYLVDRLGNAISQRRQYMKYREEHHAKLAHGLDHDDSSRTEIAPTSTVATSLPQVLKGVDQITLIGDSGSETDHSGVSATTSTSVTTMLRMPRIPKEGEDGGPFECPLCFGLISVRGHRSWRHHVYEDLLPFVCTVKDCVAPNRLYDKRDQWFEHEKLSHMRFWQCDQSCQKKFTTKSSFEERQQKDHQRKFNPTQMAAFLNFYEKPISLGAVVECPLCRERMPLHPQLRRHLGKHQVQLALFACSEQVQDECEQQTSPIDEEDKDVLWNESSGSEAEESDSSDSNASPQKEHQEQLPLRRVAGRRAVGHATLRPPCA